jgi:spermidine synthase
MPQACSAPPADSPLLPQATGERGQIARALVACFLVSGTVGLIYEVLWIRMLGLVFGHTVFAITTVLAAFMGGLGLGSLLFGRLADRSRHLVRFYGLLEIGIGAYCFCLPTLLDWAAGVYLWIARSAELPYLAFSLVQFGLVAALLVPPTTLMGATLPVLVRFFVGGRETVSRSVGMLYSVNTWGAVCGTLLAGYALVPLLGIRTTLLLAVVSNLGVGALVLAFAAHLDRLEGPQTAGAAPAADPEPARAARSAAAWAVVCGFALSGAASMIYEVTWSRALSLVIGSSTYAFTAMLVAFLCGIAGGSWLFGRLIGSRPVTPEHFALLQIAIGVSALLLVPVFGRMPTWFLQLFQLSQAHGFVLIIQFGLSLAVMLVPTLFVGATFPCAVGALTRGAHRIGYDTGWIYTVNTFGSILGTTLAGFALVPWLGIQSTMRLGVGLNLVVGLAILALARPAAGRLAWGGLFAAGLAALGLAAWLPAWSPVLMSSGVAIYGQAYLPLLRSGAFDQMEWHPDVLYYRDGISATASIHRDGPRVYLRVNGKTDAGNSGDMHTQLFCGHIPMLLHPGPKRVLVIGLGSGVTVGAVAQYPVAAIDVIEIEPAVIEASRFFAAENRNALADPRVRMIVADGRNFLLNTREPYDVIISEPSNPWIRGLATLFTQEFFALAKSRLAPDGIMLQWVQSYGIAPEDLRMVVRTFRTAFPESHLWSASVGDNFLVGAGRPHALSLRRLEEQFAASEALRADFRRAGFPEPLGMLTDHLLDAEQLARFAADGPLNLDDTLALEFSTPRSLYERGLVRLNSQLLRSYRGGDRLPVSPAERGSLDTAAAWYAIGAGYLTEGKGMLADAERAFARAVRLDPHHLPSRLELGRLLLQKGQALPALRLAEELAARHPQDGRPDALRARVFAQQGMPAEALAAFERASALRPDDAELRLQYAAALRAAGALDRAQAQYEVALARRPGDPQVLIPLAQTRLARGDARGVLGLLTPLAARPQDQLAASRGRYWQLIGSALLVAARPKEAVSAFEAATRLIPLDASILLDLSAAHEKSGDLEQALAALVRALDLAPDNTAALQRFDALAARLEARTP